MEYIQPVTSALLFLAFIFLAFKQEKYIKVLKGTNEQLKQVNSAQSGLIQDLKTYKEIFSVDDFKKNVDLKMETQKMSIEKEYAKKQDEIIDQHLQFQTKQASQIDELNEKVKFYEVSNLELTQKISENRQKELRAVQKFSTDHKSPGLSKNDILKMSEEVIKEIEFQKYIDDKVRGK
jgi:hypothetical protein